jgi:hypothetical protein
MAQNSSRHAGFWGSNRPQGRVRGNVQIDNEPLKVGGRQPSTEQTAQSNLGQGPSPRGGGGGITSLL